MPQQHGRTLRLSFAHVANPQLHCEHFSASPDRMSRVLIPRPVGPISRRVVTIEGECLAKQMKLAGSESSRRVYYSILNTVGKLCDRYFPHDRELPSGREAKQPLVDEALRKQPILKMYEDAWPIHMMLTMHRQSRRAGVRRGVMAPFPATTVRAGSCPAAGTGTGTGTGTRPGSRFKPAGVAGTVVVAINSRRPVSGGGTAHATQKRRAVSQPRRARSRSASASIGRTSTVTLSSQPAARAPKTHVHSQRSRDDANAARDATHPPAARTTDSHSRARISVRSNAAPSTSTNKPSGPGAIEAFLRALPQDLGGLLPLFQQFGVVDEDALRGMLRMPAWRSWLYSWVKEGWLTELQFRMVCDGLAQIAFG
ncbi:hypothetical protein C8Q73DRAFT_832822 [Cubamyces lactineus]|nr:hypothetical protein C8Q73DRAFT_832822 [Cubamyces lactineus]